MSRIESFSIEEIKNFLLTHNNMDEFFNFLGLRRAGGNFETIKKYMIRNNLIDIYNDFRKRALLEGKRKTGKKRALPREAIFCKNSKATRKTLKKEMQKIGIKYECSECGNKGNWQGKKLTLQVHHKNGQYNDNRLDNIVFLCPNCHSQTSNYAGKKKKKIGIKEKTKIERWKIIQQSKIDFSTFGWVKKISILFGIAENKAGKYIRNNYPTFYKEKCFKRK